MSRATNLSLLALLALVFVAAIAWAHPADEFCIPGETDLDPALCAALSSLDSADSRADLSAAAQSLLADLENRSAWETFLLYIRIGIDHIVPGGLDHILFVLGLVISTPRLRSLALQISAFTVAHTATLALTATGVLAPPSSLVESLIAASIAFVAVEAIVLKEPPKWRLGLVFVFGLVHGMGFAGAFGELGLPENQFWPGLIGFNVGVEIGQIGVALAGVLLIRATLMAARSQRADYPRWLIWPAAAIIAATGLFWTVERVWGALFPG
ncbi:MAG: HupE/UreJ family protein [Pseudomonadota bacterium]